MPWCLLCSWMVMEIYQIFDCGKLVMVREWKGNLDPAVKMLLV